MEIFFDRIQDIEYKKRQNFSSPFVKLDRYLYNLGSHKKFMRKTTN